MRLETARRFRRRAQRPGRHRRLLAPLPHRSIRDSNRGPCSARPPSGCGFHSATCARCHRCRSPRQAPFRRARRARRSVRPRFHRTTDWQTQCHENSCRALPGSRRRRRSVRIVTSVPAASRSTQGKSSKAELRMGDAVRHGIEVLSHYRKLRRHLCKLDVRQTQSFGHHSKPLVGTSKNVLLNECSTDAIQWRIHCCEFRAHRVNAGSDERRPNSAASAVPSFSSPAFAVTPAGEYATVFMATSAPDFFPKT